MILIVNEENYLLGHDGRWRQMFCWGGASEPKVYKSLRAAHNKARKLEGASVAVIPSEWKYEKYYVESGGTVIIERPHPDKAGYTVNEIKKLSDFIVKEN